jgi:hypothetical protein
MFMPGEARGPTDHPSLDPGRSFLFIAPEMRCLNIVCMIVPRGSSHPFGILMVWNDVAVVGELFMADGTFPVLLGNLAVQQFPHLCR